MAGTRQAAREQMMRDIVRAGREQLTEVRPADLSLRAVARALDIVPSALYRYVRDREALLTLLIADAYDELGGEVEQALHTASRRTHRKRLEAAFIAARAWALREPSRFALLYGTPVPGYEAPGEATVEPGLRVILALARLADDAWRAGALAPVDAGLSAKVRTDMERVRDVYGLEMPPGNVARVYGLWSAFFGAILFESFGHYTSDILSDPEAFLRTHINGLAETIGL